MGKTVLIVDDSATSRALFRAYMPEGDGYNIIDADNYTQALEMAKEKSPDICVMDYNLPDKNGLEIAQAMMDAGITSAFVLMTANTQKHVIQEAESMGFITILEKPINSDSIKDMLRQVV